MNRALLKQDAKDAMSMAQPHPVLTTLVLFVITIASTMILNFIGGIFGFTGALLGLESVSAFGVFVTMIFSVILGLLLGVIQFGYTVYCLKVFKQEDTGIGELFAWFPMILKIWGLTLWMELFILLWSCLCGIPGIIAALRYSQSFYVLAENPDMSIRDCVNESKALMSGRLWEYFVLQLSFILWGLLVSVTCGLAALYVAPYTNVTYAGYYLSLKPYDPYSGYHNGYQDGYADGYNANQQHGNTF